MRFLFKLFTLASILPLYSLPVVTSAAEVADFTSIIREPQAKVVKVFGAGGLRGLEAYQSGIIISPQGHILTAWSYVLDAGKVTIVLNDGHRLEATLLGADPLTEIAVLKCDTADPDFPYFDLTRPPTVANSGTRVLAISNLFGIATGNEAVSVVHGVVSALAPLAARRGSFSTRYRGNAYIVDAATNNPGAAGGALVDLEGNLLGLIGKEARSQITNTWLNFALPTEAFSSIAIEMMEGSFRSPQLEETTLVESPIKLDELGILLVPNVVTRTPAFIDYVRHDSPAQLSGLLPDDLVVMVNHQFINSCTDLQNYCAGINRTDTMELAVLRDGVLLEFTLNADESQE